MSKEVIGLLGEKGGGKGTFTSILQAALPQLKIELFKSSDPLFATLNSWSLPATRENLIKLSVSMNQTFGDGTLTNVVMKQIEGSDADVAIFDGMRWQSDFAAVRAVPGSVIVYVTADPKIRYQRSKTRREKVGEDEATYEQFLAEEQAQTEALVPQLGQQADFKIVNNGNLEELKLAVDQFIDKYLKDKTGHGNL